MPAYLLPAAYSGVSSRAAHLNRNPPSSEPGTDYYMPIGTPLAAPTECVVVDVGGGVGPATGRYITLDDGTRWVRYLHLKEWWRGRGDRLVPGEGFGASGASGYGSEFFGASGMHDFPWGDTGGPHVHVTAFRGRAYTFGASGTVDFHALTGGKTAFSNATPFEEDDMPTVGELFHTPIVKGPDGNDITLAQFMQYAHAWNAQSVWRHPLAHPLAKDAAGKPGMVAAGDFLRTEPAEHANTRRAIAAIAPLTDAQLEHISTVLGADTAKVVQAALAGVDTTVDYAALAKAVNDDAAKRLAN